MRLRPLCISAVLSVLTIALQQSAVAQTNFAAQGNGNWEAPGTWTPAGGPPTAIDTAIIGHSIQPGAALNATVTLGANQETNQLFLGAGTNASGTLNLNGNTLVTNFLSLGQFGGTGTINHGGGHIEARDMQIYGANSFTLDPLDVTDRLRAFDGGTIETSSASNVTQSVHVTGSGSTVNLGAALNLTEDVNVNSNGPAAATLNTNGYDVTARDINISPGGALVGSGQINASRDLNVSAGTFQLKANDFVAGYVRASDGANVDLSNTSAVQGVGVTGASTVSLYNDSVSSVVGVFDADSTLILHSDLTLSDDITVYGSGGSAATLNANGHAISAKNISVGRFGRSGRLENDGMISADRIDVLDSSALWLSGGDDIVESLLSIDGGSQLNVLQGLDEKTGLTLNGTLSVTANSMLSLDFDPNSEIGLDWAFRWANPTSGDRVAEINGLIGDGAITINSPFEVSVFDNADGYTYVGYQITAVPEPCSAILLAHLSCLGLIRRRRRSS